MMKFLAQKFNKLIENLDLTLEEVSAETKRNGSRISFSSLRNLSHGTGGTNPSGTRLLALSQTLKVPMRYLVDDKAETPYLAVLQDAQLLSDDERGSLLESLSKMQLQS